MNDGRKERKQRNKTEHQDRAKLKKKKATKNVLSRVNMFSEFVVKGFPEGGGSSIPQGKVIDFPLEGVSSPQKRWLFWSPGIWGPENTTAAPP